jgi:saccharopine dehydrogenase (NADP+, L-glutamate forming)
MKSLHDAAQSKGLLFLNECGLDPGIDHMSAARIMDEIRSGGGNLYSFESFTGGLIAPETDPGNPWRYKFTWNPRNVVTAGQGTARFLKNGAVKYVPYQQLFKRTTRIHVPRYGEFEGYANRDSLTYINTYGLHGIKTMLRGTLRYRGFCSAWNVLVQLGCCDDTTVMKDIGRMTHAEFIGSFLDGNDPHSVPDKLAATFGLQRNGPEMERLMWSSLFSDEVIGITEGTPARVLECILNKKWALSPTDKDMIVMIHKFGFTRNAKQHTIQSSLVVKGDDSVHTAMAKTVGLPLGMAAKLLLHNKIKARGVAIPTIAEIYGPILEELKHFGINMEELEETGTD